MWRYLTILAFTSSAASIIGCADETEEELRNTVNCAKICAKYDECVTEIDVSACTDRCEDSADVDENYANSASACDACVDGTCGEVQGCWASCPVVPAQE